MRRACFDADGFPLWIAAPSFAAEAPAGGTVIDVDDQGELSDLFFVRGQLVTVRRLAITADRTLVEVGGTATVTVPNPCWALVNGVRQRVSGGKLDVRPAVPGMTQIELTGAHRSDVLVIVAETADQTEAALLSQIDAGAGEARKQWLTMVPGQADAYREKMVDVASLNGLAGNLAALAAALKGYSDAQQKARWPFLYAEMKARGLPDLLQARDAIVSAADASRQVRAEIERKRRAAKLAIRAATTVAAKKAAFDAVRWN